MSSLISNTPDIEGQPAIKNTLRKISFNPRAFRPSMDSLSPQKEAAQELLLRSICKNLNANERQSIRVKAHDEAREQLLTLKTKLRKNVRKE
jgi:hypothetical protein